MAHDFAKKRSPQNKGSKRPSNKAATKTSNNSASGQWAGFFWGLLSGIFISSVIYFVALKPGVIQLPSGNTEITQSTEANTDTETQFDFYEYLRGAEVQVDVTPVALTPEEETNPVNYLLQAGSFQVRQDAESRRAKVILLNLEASIAPGVVSGKTWHRVQVGPFLGRKRAEDARDILSSNNIDTIVLRMR